jgi:Putative zinc- or iron-chelating domain
MKETIAIQRPGPEDKYSEPPHQPINCAERLPLCQAACCKLEVCLTKQDIEEQAAIINRRYPFFVMQDTTGYCVHLEDVGMCDIYEKRPAVCRSFDCSNDIRIWLDFERRIINPMILEQDWPKAIVGISNEKKQLLTARLDKFIDSQLIEEPPMSERIEGTCVITGQIIKRTEKALLLYVEAERNNFWIPKSQVDNVYTVDEETELGSVESITVNTSYAIRIPMWLGCKIGHVDSAEELEDAALSFISID